VNRGNRTERAVTAELHRHGYIVGSLRHEGGPGDHLAWLPGSWRPRPLLVETKGTLDLPWRSTWGPGDRDAMLSAGIDLDVEPILAWRPPGLGGIIWLPPEDWPEAGYVVRTYRAA
jgi:hypothetical protein